MGYDESPSHPHEFDRITKYSFLSESQLMFREYLMSVHEYPSSQITSGGTLGSSISLKDETRQCWAYLDQILNIYDTFHNLEIKYIRTAPAPNIKPKPHQFSSYETHFISLHTLRMKQQVMDLILFSFSKETFLIEQKAEGHEDTINTTLQRYML